MNKTLLVIRAFFFLLCVAGSWLIVYTNRDLETPGWLIGITGMSLGALVILVDIYLKGFSLRGLTALTFGLAVGVLIASLITVSPLFEPLVNAEEFSGMVFLIRLSLFVVCMYLASVIALRGKDEFNLVIPYVRFVPHEVKVPLVVVDTSALIDGRILEVVRTGWFAFGMVIPRFVLDELQRIADSDEPNRKSRGRKGLEVLAELRRIEHLDLRIHESEVEEREQVDAKLVFLAQNLKASLLTTDYNLAKLAEFHQVTWLNLAALAKSLNPEMDVGQELEVELVKPGKERGQAVGFLNDGSMVVVESAADRVGETVKVETASILPSAGGKMIFARLIQPRMSKKRLAKSGFHG
jgi:uncharacterized protein YacL